MIEQFSIGLIFAFGTAFFILGFVFGCINGSFLSKGNEKAGKVFFALSLISVTISLMTVPFLIARINIEIEKENKLPENYQDRIVVYNDDGGKTVYTGKIIKNQVSNTAFWGVIEKLDGTREKIYSNDGCKVEVFDNK